MSPFILMCLWGISPVNPEGFGGAYSIRWDQLSVKSVQMPLRDNEDVELCRKLSGHDPDLAWLTPSLIDSGGDPVNYDGDNS